MAIVTYHGQRPTATDLGQRLTSLRATFLRRDLHAIRADGACHSGMVGLGENYFAAFALALGVGPALAGLVTTVPLFLGAVLQLAAPWGVVLLRSHRRWVVVCALLQAVSFAPLAVGALRGEMPVPLLFAVLAVYWGAGMATMPAWNTWVGRLVPMRVRAPFFATRTRLCQAVLLSCFVAAGIGLQLAGQRQGAMTAFAALFAVALVLRLVSSAYLWRQREASLALSPPLPLRGVLERFRNSNEGRLLVYLVAIQAAVQFSGPYFTPFMLKQLDLSYGAYAVLIGTTFFAKIAAVSMWGRVARRYGAHRLLWLGTIGIIPIASLWLVSQSFWYLMMIQAISGICWAAYELALFLLLFDSIRENERVSMLTGYNLANSAATCTGALLGGGLLALLGQNQGAYLALFGISSVLRLLTVLLLIRVPGPQASSEAESASVLQPAAGVRYRIDRPHSVRGWRWKRSPQSAGEPAPVATAS